jgi:hypothetical protein
MKISHANFRSAKVIIATIVISASPAIAHASGTLKMKNTSSSLPLPHNYLSDTRTICFGRFLIDVPKDVDIAYGRQEVEGRFEFIANGANRLDSLLKEQLHELEENRYLIGSHKDDVPRYGEVISGTIPGHLIAFGSNNSVMHSLTGYIPKPPHLFIHHVDTSIDNARDLGIMNEVAKNLRLRSADEIPAEAGVCIKGGFVAYDGEFENISIGIRLKRYPDIHLSIETIKHTKHFPAGSGIEYRIKMAESLATPTELQWHKRIKYLRRGDRQLGLWHGEEVLARLPAQKGAGESHEFRFLSLGALNNPLHPEIDIELVSGVKGNTTGSAKPSLSDQEMLTLWDTLLSSIRIRPIQPVQPAPVPKAALGEIQATGRRCPQTGWWECDDVRALDDARKRFIKEGETMPYTTVRRERTAWQKLTGDPELGQSATMWTLVAYESPDDRDRTKP